MGKDYTKIQAAILIVSVALLAFLLTRSRWSASIPERAPGAAVIVELKGDVSRPGIYLIDSAKANVADATAMAGRRREVPPDLAHRKLACGQSLEVLSLEKAITIKFSRMPGAALLACGLKLDLNSASLDDFLLIPRMRPVIAASILQRGRQKPWEKLDDLTEIKGVGSKTVQKLQQYLEID